jgi:outer membrane protein assembly factor BamD
MLKLPRHAALLLAAAATLPLVGCAHGKNKSDTAYVARDVSSLYTAAKRSMDGGYYEQAAMLFD